MIDETFLTTEEVLEYLQVNLRTVYRLIKAGKIPAVRVGRQWRFRKRDIDAWLDSQRPRGGARQAPAAVAAPRPAGGNTRPRVLVVDDEHARTRGAGRRARRRRGGSLPRAAARPLAVEPCVDVAFAEPPLAADTNGGDLAGFDQPVDRPEVDLEVLEHLLGRQKRLVHHSFARSAPGLIGSSTVNMAPPSG